VEVLSIYGGADHGAQLRGLREGAPIAVATPGRLLEHIRRGTVNLENLTHLVLDEADQMMSLGFREEVEAILAKRPAKRCHIWLLSATLSKEVRQISEKWLKHPAQVILNAAKDLPSDLSQQFFATQESNKPEVLCKLLDAEDPYGLIFCQTKALASDLSSYLAVRGFLVACLHGDKDQAAREAALNDFRQHKIQLLVCTDVAARGLDIPEVTHVINFSLPRESDVYLHRVGRTARSGKAGKVLNLVSPAQRGQIRHLEDVLGTEIPEGQIPTRRELGSKKMQALLARFQAQEPFKAMDLLDEEWVEVLGNVSRREIAGRFISMLMPEIFGQDPAGKQLLGKKPKPESDYDDDEDDPEFERMVEALKAAKAKKPYQKMAPETKLAARAHQHETRDKYSPRPIRPQSEKTSRELRRLDAVDFGDKPRSHRRDDEDAKPRRFVRVERSDKDAAKGGFKGQGRSSRHEDDFKQERSSRYGQGTQKRYRDSDSRSSGRPSDERSSYRGGRSEGGERAYGRRENAEGRYGKSSGRYERAERSDSSASGRREERPYAKGTGKSFGKGGKTEGKSFGKGGGKSFGSGKGGFGKSSGKGPDRGPKKPGRR
jgi:ATP-dependent RNA helicase DeaD